MKLDIEKTTKVLLVEDDEDDVVLTEACLLELKGPNVEIKWVSNYDDAIEQLTTNAYDLCLLDQRLGNIDGLEVLKKAKGLHLLTPIIMLTGQANEQLDQEALEAGAQDFLVKSEITSVRFDRAIRYALNRRELEVARIDSERALSATKAKDRFIAHLSHELRTPLTSILGYTELLLDKEISHSIESELNIIYNNGRHLLGLLNDVLDLSKIAANKLELRIEDVYIDNFMVDVFALMEITALDKGLTLSIKANSALPKQITTDPTRFRQVVINLVNNAIKFTSEGGVEIVLSTILKEGQDFLLLEVKDTGPGIEPDAIKNIFQPFEQIADVVNRNQGGAGLGLAITTELVHRMGGEVQVDSELNIGSTFSVTLPIASELDSPREILLLDKTSNPRKNLTPPSLNGKVLVVDDLQDIRNLTGHIITSLGVKVKYAENGLDALKKVEQSILNKDYFDLILMDIHMPVMNGADAAVKIRELPCEVPIVALTSAIEKGTKQKLINAGFTSVLAKPIQRNLLYKTLKSHLTSVVIDSNGSSENTSQEPSSRYNKGTGDKEGAESPSCTLISSPLGATKTPSGSDVANAESSSTLSCLLVEDDNDAAQLMVLLLQKLGVDTVIAGSGEECLHALSQQRTWNLVLVDLGLPDMTGQALIKQIYRSNNIEKMYILSGNDIEQAFLLEYQVEDSLLKPVSLNDLTRIVDAAK